MEELAILELVRLPKLLFCSVMNDFICLQTWYFDYIKTPKHQDTRLGVIILKLAFASAVHHVWLQRTAGVLDGQIIIATANFDLRCE